MIAILAVVFAVNDASAAEFYIVQGTANGPFFNSVEYVTWRTDVFFANRSDSPATVQLLGISNGEMPDSRVAKSFSIDPHRSAVLSRNASASEWTPASAQIQTLWVIHLSVPSDLVLDDLMFIGRGAEGLGLPLPGDYPYSFGKLRLPMFSALVPANQEQVHAATFLGSPNYIPSRSNVAIYNGGVITATARIDFRDYCDDSLLASTTVAVPANAIIQTSLTTPTEVHCFDQPRAAVYTVVSVDQPSFSFVSNLSNRDIPLTSISISN